MITGRWRRPGTAELRPEQRPGQAANQKQARVAETETRRPEGDRRPGETRRPEVRPKPEAEEAGWCSGSRVSPSRVSRLAPRPLALALAFRLAL
jgi:hypothetical protein